MLVIQRVLLLAGKGKFFDTRIYTHFPECATLLLKIV